MKKARTIAGLHYPNKAGNRFDEKYRQSRINALEKLIAEQLTLTDVVNCVYVVTERDNYGEQLFRQVFAKEEQAIEYLSKQGLTADNIDEINEIELD